MRDSGAGIIIGDRCPPALCFLRWW